MLKLIGSKPSYALKWCKPNNDDDHDVWLSLHVAGMITDLYIDSFKFRGRNVKGKIQQLMSVLENYTFEGLLEFFSSSAAQQ